MTNKDEYSLNLIEDASDYELRERQEAIRDIRDAREKLGNFTLRYMMEAVYGDEYAKKVLGESGGHIKMKDLKTEARRAGPGAVGVRIEKEQLRQILTEAHPELPANEIEKMIEGELKRAQGKSSNQPVPIREENTSDVEAELAAMSPEERQVILKFMRKMTSSK